MSKSLPLSTAALPNLTRINKLEPGTTEIKRRMSTTNEPLKPQVSNKLQGYSKTSKETDRTRTRTQSRNRKKSRVKKNRTLLKNDYSKAAKGGGIGVLSPIQRAMRSLLPVSSSKNQKNQQKTEKPNIEQLNATKALQGCNENSNFNPFQPTDGVLISHSQDFIQSKKIAKNLGTKISARNIHCYKKRDSVQHLDPQIILEPTDLADLESSQSSKLCLKFDSVGLPCQAEDNKHSKKNPFNRFSSAKKSNFYQKSEKIVNPQNANDQDQMDLLDLERLKTSEGEQNNKKIITEAFRNLVINPGNRLGNQEFHELVQRAVDLLSEKGESWSLADVAMMARPVTRSSESGVIKPSFTDYLRYRLIQRKLTRKRYAKLAQKVRFCKRVDFIN